MAIGKLLTKKIDINKVLIKKLSSQNLNDLMLLQKEALELYNDEEILRKNEQNMLLECLINHVTIGLFYKNNLIAFGILFFGEETMENLGIDLGIEKNKLREVANIKLIIVKQEFRGNKLQGLLIKKLIEESKQKQIKILAATISPKNNASVKNFERAGFKYYTTKNKYNNYPRLVYYLNI